MNSIRDLIKTREEDSRQEVVEAKNLKGLKINNSNSEISKPIPRIDPEKNAKAILSSHQEQHKAAWGLTTKLLSIFKDKTLQENKSHKEKEEEGLALLDFAKFAMLINGDEKQPEGNGSVSFAVAIVKCALIQRDRINELEFEVFNLSKIIKRMEAENNKNT